MTTRLRQTLCGGAEHAEKGKLGVSGGRRRGQHGRTDVRCVIGGCEQGLRQRGRPRGDLQVGQGVWGPPRFTTEGHRRKGSCVDRVSRRPDRRLEKQAMWALPSKYVLSTFYAPSTIPKAEPAALSTSCH